MHGDMLDRPEVQLKDLGAVIGHAMAIAKHETNYVNDMRAWLNEKIRTGALNSLQIATIEATVSAYLN